MLPFCERQRLLYRCSVVMEAEQDPAVADPRTYATLGYEFLARAVRGRFRGRFSTAISRTGPGAMPLLRGATMARTSIDTGGNDATDR